MLILFALFLVSSTPLPAYPVTSFITALSLNYLVKSVKDLLENAAPVLGIGT